MKSEAVASNVSMTVIQLSHTVAAATTTSGQSPTTAKLNSQRERKHRPCSKSKQSHYLCCHVNVKNNQTVFGNWWSYEALDRSSLWFWYLSSGTLSGSALSWAAIMMQIIINTLLVVIDSLCPLSGRTTTTMRMAKTNYWLLKRYWIYLLQSWFTFSIH